MESTTVSSVTKPSQTGFAPRRRSTGDGWTTTTLEWAHVPKQSLLVRTRVLEKDLKRII